MFRFPHRPLLRTALAAVIALDLLSLLAFVLDQWLGLQSGPAWAIAGVLALPVVALLLPVSDALLVLAESVEAVPPMGEKIPGTGQ